MAWGENILPFILEGEETFRAGFRIAFPLIIIVSNPALLWCVDEGRASTQCLVTWFRVRDSHVSSWFLSLS